MGATCMLGCALVATLLFASSCRLPRAARVRPHQQDAAVQPGPVLPELTARDVPWRDRAYDLGEGDLTPFTEGSYRQLDDTGNCEVCRVIRGVVFGDLDGDQREEALVLVSTHLGGAATDLSAYLYRIVHGRPELVTALEGGDRGAGGIDSAVIEQGVLVLRRFDGASACCPDQVQVERWRLVGREVVLDGEPRRASRDPLPWHRGP